jgi:hypothetical protein
MVVILTHFDDPEFRAAAAQAGACAFVLKEDLTTLKEVCHVHATSTYKAP